MPPAEPGGVGAALLGPARPGPPRPPPPRSQQHFLGTVRGALRSAVPLNYHFFFFLLEKDLGVSEETISRCSEGKERYHSELL